MIDKIDAGHMPYSNRTHLDDFSIDEFDAILRTENAGLSHAVIFVDGEKLLGSLDLHLGCPFESMILQNAPRNARRTWRCSFQAKAFCAQNKGPNHYRTVKNREACKSYWQKSRLPMDRADSPDP